MYINQFLAGVLTTIFVELVVSAVIVFEITFSEYKKGKKK